MTNNSTIERDQYICQDYTDGMEIHELSRTYGVSERRISQILSENNITRRPRSTQQKSALSNHHTRLIWASTSTPTGATDDLGWSGGRLGGQPTFAAVVSHPSCQVGSRQSDHAELGLDAAPPQGGFELYADPETRTAEVNRRTICVFADDQ